MNAMRYSTYPDYTDRLFQAILSLIRVAMNGLGGSLILLSKKLGTQKAEAVLCYAFAGCSAVLGFIFFLLHRSGHTGAIAVGTVAVLCTLLARQVEDFSDLLERAGNRISKAGGRLSAEDDVKTLSVPISSEKKGGAEMQMCREVDNVGKVFFSVSNQRVTKVFRFSCVLGEPVDGPALSRALQMTVKEFPFFQVEANRGMFWYSLKKSNLTSVALPEFAPPCNQIFQKDVRGLLYDVTYSGNRINLDIFHALTDGTGASYFLRMLVVAYLTVIRGEPVKPAALTGYFGLTAPLYESDDYTRYYEKRSKRSGSRIRRAYQIKANLLPGYRNAMIKGEAQTDAILRECHNRGITVTELLTAVYMKAIHSTMSEKDQARPVVIAIPVNLRKYYQSQTARNFFAMVNVGYDFSTGSGDLTAVAASVHLDLTEQLDSEHLQSNFSRFVALEKNRAVQHIPLSLKNAGLRFANWQSERYVTSVFSNVGQISMPDEFASCVKSFDFLDKTESIKLCVVSYANTMSINFTSALADNSVIKAFFHELAEIGIDASVETGYSYHEHEYGWRPVLVPGATSLRNAQ